MNFKLKFKKIFNALTLDLMTFSAVTPSLRSPFEMSCGVSGAFPDNALPLIASAIGKVPKGLTGPQLTKEGPVTRAEQVWSDDAAIRDDVTPRHAVIFCRGSWLRYHLLSPVLRCGGQ